MRNSSYKKNHPLALCLPPNLKAANSKTWDVANNEDGDDPTTDLCQVEVAGASEGQINNNIEISNYEMRLTLILRLTIELILTIEMISIKRRIDQTKNNDKKDPSLRQRGRNVFC